MLFSDLTPRDATAYSVVRKQRLVAGGTALAFVFSGLGPNSTTSDLCDFGQVTQLPWFHFLQVKHWDWISRRVSQDGL